MTKETSITEMYEGKIRTDYNYIINYFTQALLTAVTNAAQDGTNIKEISIPVPKLYNQILFKHRKYRWSNRSLPGFTEKGAEILHMVHTDVSAILDQEDRDWKKTPFISSFSLSRSENADIQGYKGLMLNTTFVINKMVMTTVSSNNVSKIKESKRIWYDLRKPDDPVWLQGLKLLASGFIAIVMLAVWLIVSIFLLFGLLLSALSA